MNLEDEYLRRVKEINEKLNEPKINKEISNLLIKLSKKYNADFQLVFEVFPESDEYEERLAANKIDAPRDYPTLTLGEFIKHIDTEDHDMKVYFDPLYFSEGVNCIQNILTTTIGDDAMIIIPVSHKKK